MHSKNNCYTQLLNSNLPGLGDQSFRKFHEDSNSDIDFSDVGIETAVGLALGMASMCWVEVDGQQVFDSSRADQIRKALMNKIADVLR